MRLDEGDYWIDDYGTWNHVASGQLCPFFAAPGLRNAQRMDLAFRRLGMVRVSKRRETVTVQWDISAACDESLDSACDFLWSSPGEGPTKLRFYCGGWAHEILDSVRKALVRLEVLRSYRNVTPFPGARIKPIDEAATEKDATATIQRTQRLLAESGGVLDGDLWKRFAEKNLSDRLLLFQEEDGGSWLSFRYIGQRSLFSQVFGPKVSKSIIGRHSTIDPATSRPGCYVSRTYPKVLASGVEQIDQVLAPIKPNNDDGIWVSYQRLLVPCSTRKGRRLLLVVADPTQESLIPA